MIKYSIIVPVYNVELYIEDCINSILNQTYQNFELILIDDGSIDNSLSICKSFIRPNVFVYSQSNAGHTLTRLKGLSYASGEYVVFVDSDDLLKEDFLELANEAIIKDNVDLVVGSIFKYIDGFIDVNSYHNLYVDKVYNYQDIVNLIYPSLLMTKKGDYFPRSLCAKVIKKDIAIKALESVPKEIRIGEDSLCVILMFKYIKSLVIKSSISYYYRQRTTSITKRTSDNEISLSAYSVKFLLSNIEGDLSIFKDQVSRYITMRVYSAISISLRTCSTSYALKQYNKLVKDNNLKLLINHSKFSSLKLTLKKLLVKYKLFFIIKLISRRDVK